MVSLSCGYRCLQIILVILNTFVIACGVGLIVVGSLAEVSLKTFGESNETSVQIVVIFIICLGCLIFLIGFLGFCGACLKNVCMLITYAILLGVTAVAQVVCGITGLVLRDKIPALVNHNLEVLYTDYSSNADVRKLIDVIQKELKCCGAAGTWANPGAEPESCRSPEGVVYTDGCVPKVEEFIQENLVAMGVCVFIFALIQLICMTFAICVVQALRKGEGETV
ncbi:cd63 antigen [Clonorchis sinensis]|uniref:Tetraspanin n=1 Tax=Clonorchis sinensis TaxID=79923 RepID=A0A3R7DEP1_CLOSI|nr:cd63 antigen [Clonorchis sinensis]